MIMRNKSVPICLTCYFSMGATLEVAILYWLEWAELGIIEGQIWSTASNPARIFEDYAVNLSLNVEKFRQDVASITVNDIISADLKAGQALGADSTPTFVLDGKKLEEIPRAYEGFKKLIDDTIAAKSTGNNR